MTTIAAPIYIAQDKAGKTLRTEVATPGAFSRLASWCLDRGFFGFRVKLVKSTPTIELDESDLIPSHDGLFSDLKKCGIWTTPDLTHLSK